VIGTAQLTDSQRKALGIETESRDLHRVTVHTLRHSFVTLLSDAGVDLRYRQLAANHASAATTLEYDHSGPDIFESLRDKFNPPR
jgi:integrase/recombinase XerD